MAARAFRNEDTRGRTVVVVTGANKGIGLELCKLLVSHDDVHVIATCRNFAFIPKPKHARNKKHADNWEVVNRRNPNQTRIQILRDVRFKGINNIDFVELDITEKRSCSNAASVIKNQFGKIDILVNNAGIAFKGDTFDVNVVNTTLNTNYYGTINATKAFLPLINNGGRVIMVSSRAGLLEDNIEDEVIQKSLLDPKLTINGVEKFLSDFRGCVWKDKSLRNAPYERSAYGMSKVAMSAYSRILARSLVKKCVFVGAYCPGYCATFMTSGRGWRPAANGAKGLELLCTENVEMMHSGMFWGVDFHDDDDIATGYLVNYDWTTGDVIQRPKKKATRKRKNPPAKGRAKKRQRVK